MVGLCLAFWRELYDLPKGPFLNCSFIVRNTLAAFQKGLHVANESVGLSREQMSMASAVLPADPLVLSSGDCVVCADAPKSTNVSCHGPSA